MIQEWCYCRIPLPTVCRINTWDTRCTNQPINSISKNWWVTNGERHSNIATFSLSSELVTTMSNLSRITETKVIKSRHKKCSGSIRNKESCRTCKRDWSFQRGSTIDSQALKTRRGWKGRSESWWKNCTRIIRNRIHWVYHCSLCNLIHMQQQHSNTECKDGWNVRRRHSMQ